ncbi:4a-hydroxytetrahydrobiopterin dehydratase [Granulicella mallensis]|uniref:Putative pterin-4-alpha-carbinolamine dehydratase n=1 Tax=Granulicella mallensis (strain ATCC BAA-1857 / DSM 23137 / MP5ACTX8) TaxID=682795 RepID=G8NX74_GRAMM|nr:4a-hydroxytetrahydrobiopterin dehydratase [Granulicella mallensis]AEU36688.1 transcriptional coactivator/pterin dehydratase [Granulicella mallensis MP5ACTX8]
MQKLNEQELRDAVAALSQWKLEEGKLVRDWKFADFIAAMEFVDRVAVLAEAAGHHPDIDIRYNRVRLALVTHDAGGITAKDADMAASLNEALGTQKTA